MITTIGGFALIFGASLIVGQAVLVVTRHPPCWWLAPAVGLATLIVTAGAAARLPGKALPTAAVVLVATLAATAFLVRAGIRPARPRKRAVGVLAAAFSLSMLPFLANARFGILGMSFNNDTAGHLIWAEGLLDEFAERNYPTPDDYPIGPHSLVAAVGKLTMIELDALLNGLMIVTGLAAALAAQQFLRRTPGFAAVAVGALVAFPYLPAGYYGQGSFKELLQPMLLIAFAALLREGAERAPPTRRGALAAGVAPGLVAAATVYSYSLAGLVWIVSFVFAWAVLESLTDALSARRLRFPPALRPAKAVVVGAVVVALIAIFPELDRLWEYVREVGPSPARSGVIPGEALGNLVGPLSPYEGLGVWPSADYRVPPTNHFHAGQLAAIALGVGIFAAVWLLGRRDLIVPAMVVAGGAVYYYATVAESPYVAAKALMILTPPFMLMCGSALFDRPNGRWRAGADATGLRYLMGAVFVIAATYSSFLVLRGSQVAPPAPLDQLRELSVRTGEHATLFLGNDDFVAWAMRDSRLAHIDASNEFDPPVELEVREEKPWQYGQPLDFDSVDAEFLDEFEYTVTSRSSYASAPPANFRLVERTQLYELWQRIGRTRPRLTLEPGSAPGAVMDCEQGSGQRLRGLAGIAHVTAEPVPIPAIPPLPPGGSATVPLTLPPGRWNLSAQYVSPQDLTYSVGGRRFELPANLGRPGPFFDLGQLQVDGGVQTLTVRADDAGALASATHVAYPGRVVATRVGTGRTVPLARACGRYVDWYQLG